jgi:DNA-binding transcriptional regulator PaaX
MEKFERGELAKNILLTLAGVGLVIIVCALPGTPQILTLFKAKNNKDRYRIKRSIQGLQKKKFVKIYSKGGKEIMELTELGKTKVFEYKIDDMKLEKPAKWDGWWRIVSFDIPIKKNVARRTFNYKLRELGFFALQKSIFVTPYECKNEIDFISNYYFVQKNVLYIKAREISNEDKVKKYFELD